MIQVIGIGAALFDMLMTAGTFPEEDTKIEGISTKIQCGGPCATALVALAKLGVSAEYMGTVGDDMYGRYILGEFRKYGVDVSKVHVVPGAVSFHSFVLCNVKNASRTCIWNKGSVPMPQKEDIDLDVLKNAAYLHMDGHQLDTAVYAARKAREYGVKTSLDAGGVYPGIERLLPFIDILIPSEEFAQKLTGKADACEAAAILEKRYHPEILLITQGAKGGFLWKNEKSIRYRAFKVNAIDTNGAGDTFHGAFLAGRLKGMDVLEAAEFASAVSALKCTRFGAQEGIPGLEEAENFLKQQEAVSEKEG